MNAIPELSELRAQWQTQRATHIDAAMLRQRVTSDTRAHKRTVLVVAIGTLLVIAATVIQALRNGNPGAWVAVVFTVSFAVLVWLVALLLSRGTWQPREETTAGYLDVSIRRCRSVIIAAPVGIVLYVAGLIGSLAWRQRMLGIEWQMLLDSPGMIIAGWIGAPAYAITMLVNARLQRRRLVMLEQLRRQLGEN